jgi:hypothetical protein
MAKLPHKKDVLGIRIRTLNEEYTLPIEQSKFVFEKIEKQLRDKKVEDLWIVRDNNEPDKGDIHPNFIKATFKFFLEKLGYEIKNVGDIRISKQKGISKNTFAVFAFFNGRDNNHLKEKSVRKEQTTIRIKKRKEKRKRKNKK